ncbi:MAG: response regulator transcription factor [Bacteroidetes bacterium]|nr:response regulator transcription factor [Bacteroidota bacterium]
MEKVRVCIVEDNQDIRSGLQMIIDSSNEIYCERTFSNAEDAIESLVNEPTDVVLMDINLPGMNGIEAIIKLRESCPQTQFMMLTVYEDDDMIFKSLQAGATGYLLKKSSVTQIAQSIMDLYNGGSPMSPGIARKILNTFREGPQKPIPDYQDLSEREKELVNSLAQGYRYKEIADQLNISPATVRTHIQNIYKKLHVQSRTDAINKIFK